MAHQSPSSSSAIPAQSPLAAGDSGRSQDLLLTSGLDRSAGAAASTSTPKHARKVNKSKKQTPCRFYASKNGCRAGASCPFLHDRAATQPDMSEIQNGAGDIGDDNPAPIAGLGDANEKTNAPPIPMRTQRPVVTKPVPKQQHADPREFELTQLRRRFSPKEEDTPSATNLMFNLVPSDPDFPFELNGLQTTLTIPKTYPTSGKPSVRVANPEMERGYQINVERGFDSLVIRYPAKTLLGLVNELDKHLEEFLVAEKTQTIKITANYKGTQPLDPQPEPQPVQQSPVQRVVSPPSQAAVTHAPVFTTQQKTDARSKRDSDLRQLEARMGRQPLFSKSSHVSFNIPLQIPKPGRLPISLQSVKEVQLLVPLLYPLDACTIRFQEGSEDAEIVEMAFEKHARAYPGLSLMAHINHLVQNMHNMAQEKIARDVVKNVPSLPLATTEPKEKQPVQKENENQPRVLDEDRPHIQIIQRPPEWDIQATESDDEEEEDSSDWDESFSEEEEDGGTQVPSADLATGPETGVLLSFPFIELYGIELLQISSLSLTVKCDRCKEVMDIKNIKPGGVSTTEICKKCACALSAGYRSELLHMNSIRAGFLDLEGCSVVDLLPTNFLPTCSECSTTFTSSPGLVSVRGETTMAICRECHKKMTFKLPEVKFLRVSSAERPNRPLPRKKAKENLGIVAGQELPKKGRCSHYAKSYRWFRFSCCGKVYPCDRCHDAVEEHPTEHANRMICGLCSREQYYRPEDCGLCHSGLVGRKGGGFWEGGKGTRDKVKMNRKDPRKYKRRGGSKVGGGGK